jgi:hypothetical protein
MTEENKKVMEYLPVVDLFPQFSGDGIKKI